MPADLLARLTAATPEMVDDLRALVEVESPTADVAAVSLAAAAVADLGERLIGRRPEVVEVDGGRPHLRWRPTTTTTRPVLLVGHFDTVWPLGTLARWPFSVAGDTATGPGCFDMKAGIVQMFHALAALGDLEGVDIVLTSDEEVGSPSSRELIEEAARGAGAALVLEPSAGDALKTARKGVSLYGIEVDGRAAHAGLEPEKGANALIEMAHQVLALGAVARPEVGTTVTPTVASSGTTSNTVPAAARVKVDVRAAVVEEQERVDREVRALAAATTVEGTTVRVIGGPNRPPLPATASTALFARAGELADGLGLGTLRAVEVGGGSDGNFTAGVGTPTLDGLGAVGGNAHAEGEHVSVAAMAGRAALTAALVDDLRRNPLR